MQVYKFGGASVKDAQGVRNVADIVAKQKDKVVVIVSAMGKMTNAFELLIKAYFSQRDYQKELSQIESFHKGIIKELDLNDNLFYGHYTNLKKELNSLVSKNYNYEYDRLVGYGELFSTSIIQTYFEKQNMDSEWIDVRNIIKTDSNFRFSHVDWEETEKRVQTSFFSDDKRIFLTQGFIASDIKSNMTTLGREGSDYSAAILAYVLEAEEVTIWKDVPGVLNADPRFFDNADLIGYLSYHEAIELAFYGAQVIHPKTIQPLKKKRISLNVKSFLFPENEGTVVSDCQEKVQTSIVIVKKNQVLLSVRMRDFSFVDETNISLVFSILSDYNAKVNMMQNSAVSFSVAIDYQEMYFDDLISDLEKSFELRYNKGLELITIRYYTKDKIVELTSDKKIFLEQKSRNTAQYLVSN